MFAEHRRSLILQRIARDGMVRVADLVNESGMNAMTIRRDLTALENAGRLRRVYGGATATAQRGVRQQRRIGLMVPDTNSYYGPVVKGAEQAARRFGGQLVLATYFPMANLDHERLERLIELDLDALILTPEPLRRPIEGWSDIDHDAPLVTDALLRRLIGGLRRPVVLLERDFPMGVRVPNLGVVRSAHDRGAFLAVQHFHRLGHRRVLVAVRSTVTAPSILAGATHAAVALGIQVDVHRVASEADVVELATVCRTGAHGALLLHPDPFARHLVDRLREHDIQTPRDIHVITYNDLQASNSLVPLSAVAPAKEELGFEAVRMALRQIDSPTQRTVHRLILEPQLVLRDSTPPVRSAARV